MNKQQGNKLNMYDSALNHHKKNLKVAEAIPALQNSFTALGLVKAAIDGTFAQQAVSKKGHTVIKGNNKKSLSEFGNEVAGAIFAWAALNNKPVIQEQVKTSASELWAMRDEKMGKLCLRFYEIATENAPLLGDFGISADVLDSFKKEIDSYEAAVPEPRNATARQSSYRTKLIELFKKGDAILKNQIDKLVLPLKKTNPDYYREYRANRRIVNTGATATAFVITVTDAASGLPIVGADIMVEAIKWETLTDKQGQAIAKPVPVGTYTATIKKEGYQSQSIDELKATMGKTNKVEVALEKTD